jgi:hypothetical protein
MRTDIILDAPDGRQLVIDTKFTSILASPALLVGAQGGWIINHRFILGLGGYGLATRHDVPTEMQAANVKPQTGAAKVKMVCYL